MRQLNGRKKVSYRMAFRRFQFGNSVWNPQVEGVMWMQKFCLKNCSFSAMPSDMFLFEEMIFTFVKDTLKFFREFVFVSGIATQTNGKETPKMSEPTRDSLAVTRLRAKHFKDNPQLLRILSIIHHCCLLLLLLLLLSQHSRLYLIWWFFRNFERKWQTQKGSS